MRAISALILIAFVAAIVVFVVQNSHQISVVLFGPSVTASVGLIVGAAFVLGMLTGGAMWGLLRRSAERAFGDDRRRS